MIDTQTALEAQANILWLADHWADLTARLEPGSSASTNEIRSPSPDRQLPIDTFISDLMAEIDWQVARHYSNALLMDEPDWRPPSWTTEGMLRGIAERYGHFVTSDGWGQAFCDDAHDYRERVRKAFDRPPPPEYLGPCPMVINDEECVGELYAHGSATTVRCPKCLTETTREAQRGYVAEEMDGRLMTVTELGRALKIVGNPVPPGTLRRWVSGETPKIKAIEDGLYRLADAIAEAGKRKEKVT